MSNPFIIKWTPNKGGYIDFNAGGGGSGGNKSISVINFNNPTIITGCQLWLDATDPLNTGTPPTNGSNVTTWYDKSGIGRNATQFSSNAAYYGTYNSTGFNNKPTINFASSVTGYTVSIPQSLFNNGVTASTGFTIFMIFNYGASGYSYGALYTLGYNNLGDPMDIYGASRVTTIGISGTSPNVTSYTNTTLFSSSCDSTNNGSYSEWYNGGNATNSVSATTTNPTYTSAITGYFRIGQSSSALYIGTRADKVTSFIGNISEVIMYNKILTSSDRQLIEGYLAWKWGLQTKLPTTHPYYNSIPTISITSLTPISVTGNILWLDSSDPSNSGIQPSNGSAITSWIDKLNRYIFSQNNSSQKPTYSINALNGLPTILFSSASSQFFDGGTSFPIGTGSVAFFVVFKTNDGTSGASIFNKSLYGPGSRFLCERNANSGMSIFFITSGNAATNSDTSNVIETQSTGSLSTSSYTVGNYRILSYIFNRNAATSTIYFNGTSILSSTGLSSTITTFDFTNTYNALIGGYNNGSGGLPGTTGANQDSIYLNGNIAEILWYKNTYDMDLVTSQKIEGYLASKWGLQSKLPSTHPYYNSTPNSIVSSIYYLPSDPYLYNSNILLSYSVRLLNSTYTGPVFNIRRSSDNVTQDFYADTLQTYLTTGPGGTGTSFSTWIGANTGYVTIWYDQSGRGNNATNTSNNTTQPNISLQNGKYVIQWQNANSTTINTTTAITPNTIFCQFWNNNATYGAIFSVSGGQGIRFGGGTSPGLNINGDSNSADWYYSSSGTKLVYSNNVNLSSTLVLSGLSTWQVFSASTQTPASFSMNLIGADGYSNTRALNGFMTEFICHNTQMAASSMTSFYNNRLI